MKTDAETSTTSTVPSTKHERSPLLMTSGDPEEERASPRSDSRNQSATVPETMTNLAKTCMGTGCLTLPYAAREGGLLLYTFGLIGIALWNVYAAQRLCDCYDLIFGKSTVRSKQRDDLSLQTGDRTEERTLSDEDLQQQQQPPIGTATLGKVAWYALGPTGLAVMDVTTLILLLGIIVAYNDAIRSFLQGTVLTTGTDTFDAVLIALMIAPLSIVEDMGYLTKTSAAGLSVLAFALIVIAGYGIFENSSENLFSEVNWLPRDGLSGVSHWFGCCVFGFGIVPLTFNFRESMAEPSKLPHATLSALLLVAVVYILIGILLLVMYPEIENDVLSEIPDEGILPTITRLSMVVVVVATAPLLIVPCGELIEGKISRSDVSFRTKSIVRFTICFVTVAISVGVPGFVGVLTFVGCFCVAFVSFCIPPALHIVLLVRLQADFKELILDLLMLSWGMAATLISTSYVFRTL